MMEATGKMKRIKRAYSTNDIVKVVVSVNRDYWHQCSEFAKQFQRPTEYETCKAVNDFVVENIQYKEDGSTHQYVKTPARLLKDKEGDCKSMSIFVASCLTCLQIPCSLRFVSFGSTDVKHVYVVTQSGLNVDPVEMIQKRRKFGEITLFTHHIDMKANYGLAILSGVGSAEPYQAFLNGTDFLRNTRATNYIYSCIDLQMAILRADTNNIEAMNNLCRFITTLVLYNESTGYNSLHLISANIIQLLDDRGYFNSPSISDEVREQDLEKTISLALDLLASDASYVNPGPWNDWYMTEIAINDYNGMSSQDIIAFQDAQSKGVGAINPNQYLNDIKGLGPAILYYFASEDYIDKLAKKSPIIKAKRAMESNAINRIASAMDGVLTKNSLLNTAYAGCIEKFQTKNATEAMQQFVTTGNPEIGIAATVIAAIITGAIALITSILSVTFGYINNRNALKAKEIEQSLQEVQSGESVPDLSDIADMYTPETGLPGDISYTDDTDNTQQAGMGSLLFIGAAGLLAYKFFKKDKV